MNNKIDFNKKIIKFLQNRYGGSEKKDTILYEDGNIYLLKLPDRIRETGHMMSYMNNPVSEYLGCKILQSIGFKTQDVILGEYTDKSGKSVIACACRDITQNGKYVLAEAKNAILNSENTNKESVTFKAFEDIINCVRGIDKDIIKKWYYELFVADAFIGNPDRHNNNWGFLTNTEETLIAPVYDCGSSLSPLLDDSELSEEIAGHEAKNAVSVIKDDNGKCLKYINALQNTNDGYLTDALCKVVPNIKMDQIKGIISDIPYLSEKRKNFYISLLTIRYEQILLPALELHLKTKCQNKTFVIEDPYKLYKDVLCDFSNLPVYEEMELEINGENKTAYRTSNKYLIIKNNSEKAECIIPIRSNNNDIRKAVNALCNTYNIELSGLSDSIQSDCKDLEIDR